jgi:hypothetical protein
MTAAIHMYSPQPRKENAPLTFRWFVDCDGCRGYGWFTNDGYSEEYCKCEASKWRRIYDGGKP